MEDLLEPWLPSFHETFTTSAVERARAAGMRLDVLVLDGNAKNRRAVCPALLAGATHSDALGKTLRHTCPGTPKLGHLFCPSHTPTDVEEQHEDCSCQVCVCVCVFLRVNVSVATGTVSM